MGDTLAKLKVILEASTASYKKEMEKAQKVTKNVSDSVKADIFGFNITDVSGSIKVFSDVMKQLGIKLDGDGLYEEFQKIYDEAISRDADKEKVGDMKLSKSRER